MSFLAGRGCSTRPDLLARKSERVQDGRSTKKDVEDLFGPAHQKNIVKAAPGTSVADLNRLVYLNASIDPPPARGVTVEVWWYDFDDSSVTAILTLDNTKATRSDFRVGFDEQGTVTIHRLSRGLRRSADPCFVVTAVYGSDRCPEVAALRRFRDEVLLRTALGRLVVRAYYRVGPLAAALLQARPRLRGIVKPALDLFVRALS